MKSTQTHSNGGYWMLVGLVVLLALPVVVGHFALKPAAADVSVHADASSAQ